jgi:aldose 1-epimerase
MTLLSLKTGRLALDLAPTAGGSIAGCTVDGRDVMRPMAADEKASGRGIHASCYPLVPFAGRIGNGRLLFQGEELQLGPNWPGLRHPMHGDGWWHPWQVVKSDTFSAELAYLHERADKQGGWPFRYRAQQRFNLEGNRLTIGISIENLEDRIVPAGIGLHPYFARDADSRLACRTQTVWRMDAEVLPLEKIPVPPEWEFANGRVVNDVALDTAFEGWDGRATLTWPARKLRMDLAATGALAHHLVLYLPTGQSFFCVEPLSHTPGQIATTSLGARATLAGEATFQFSNL